MHTRTKFNRAAISTVVAPQSYWNACVGENSDWLRPPVQVYDRPHRNTSLAGSSHKNRGRWGTRFRLMRSVMVTYSPPTTRA
jgi:hypothetical protein